MWEAELRDLFGAYVEAKQAQNVLDYDDLLLYWAHDDARARARRRSRRALRPCAGRRIPGHQPAAGRRSSSALKPDGRGLTVVGDDAQSIYSFRAATVRNILDFPTSFSPPADIVTLDRNYRSTAPILEAANAVIAEADRALHQEPLDRTPVDRQAAARHRARRGRPGPLCRRARARKPRGRRWR